MWGSHIGSRTIRLPWTRGRLGSQQETKAAVSKGSMHWDPSQCHFPQQVPSLDIPSLHAVQRPSPLLQRSSGSGSSVRIRFRFPQGQSTWLTTFPMSLFMGSRRCRCNTRTNVWKWDHDCHTRVLQACASCLHPSAWNPRSAALLSAWLTPFVYEALHKQTQGLPLLWNLLQSQEDLTASLSFLCVVLQLRQSLCFQIWSFFP